MEETTIEGHPGKAKLILEGANEPDHTFKITSDMSSRDQEQNSGNEHQQILRTSNSVSTFFRTI